MREALLQSPGVTDVTIDIDSQTATCTIKPDEFDSAKSIASLDEAGFPDSTVKK